MFSWFGLLLVLFAEGTEAGPRCYECLDISSPLECGIATFCSDNQECYVDQLISSGGLVLYNTGCRSKQLCSASGRRSVLTDRQTNDIITCSQCCTGDFCNEQGCGIKAPNPLLKGPNCFKCSNMAFPSECRQVVTCEQGEMCALYEVNKYGTPLYESRCESQTVCQVIATLPQPVGRRRQTSKQLLCHSCCTGDFCNDRCNTSVSMTTVTMTNASRMHTATSAVQAITTQPSATTSTMLKSTMTSPTTTFSTSSLSVDDRCKQNGYSYLSFLQFCFKLHFESLDWTSANNVCISEGGTLAVVDVKTKWDFLKIILGQETNFVNKYIWLGARDVKNSNTFYWTTGSPVNFNNWRFGNPENFASGADGKCISTVAADNLYWHDILCTHHNPFVCTKFV